ncbi:NAD(P)H-dependent flavin oxidoreductase [Streptomyces niveus]|uniref:NAD(P)H-dependent flavin oxidoreductase n=1 Tax=Streptomyces niveus TaxID=193462 RepID=UPI00364159FC
MNRLQAVLGLQLPLIQAGMGGVAGTRLCTEVSRAGAGGTLALYKESPDRIREAVREVAAATSRPFGVNIIPEVTSPELCRAQLDSALGELPANGYVTTFGLPGADAARDVTRTGRPLVVQIGTPDEASAALGVGADVLVLQGTEAGGHLLGGLPVAELLYAVRTRHPEAVIAVAGGVATGADLARALSAGADGAMAGTVFVPTPESMAHPLFKRRIVDARADDTVVTGRYDIGWPARPHRVLRNALTEESSRLPATFIATTRVGAARIPVPRYSATVPGAGTEGRIDEMAMYCGTSCDRVTAQDTAAAVVRQIRHEYEHEDSYSYETEGGTWTAPSNR